MSAHWISLLNAVALIANIAPPTLDFPVIAGVQNREQAIRHPETPEALAVAASMKAAELLVLDRLRNGELRAWGRRARHLLDSAPADTREEIASAACDHPDLVVVAHFNAIALAPPRDPGGPTVFDGKARECWLNVVLSRDEVRGLRLAPDETSALHRMAFLQRKAIATRGGRLKRDDLAQQVSRETGYPQRKCRDLYSKLEPELRHHARRAPSRARSRAASGARL